jgi:hypothetical protein
MLAVLKKIQADDLNAEGSVIIPPRSPLTSVYLYRMDVFRAIAGDIPEEFERHEPWGFRPCRHFTDEDAVDIARDVTPVTS